jgi:type II secretory pathway pseudopilin PulG
MTTRRGASLVELLVIMSACIVILTLTGILLTRVMRVQIQSRGLEAAERAAQRLSDQFRSDVHRASDVVVDDANQEQRAFLRLAFADNHKIEYSRAGDLVSRVESTSGQPAWREEFICPAASEFSLKRETHPSRLALTVFMKVSDATPTPGKPFIGMGAAPVIVHAEAVIGRDFQPRAAKPAEETKK